MKAKLKSSAVGKAKVKKFFPLFIVFFASIICFFVILFLFVAFLLPIPKSFLFEKEVPTSKIYDSKGVLLYEILSPLHGRKTKLNFSEIPEDFIKAIIAAEDKNFFNHQGLDFSAVSRAVFYNISRRKIISGASTITQQLVRNMLGTTEKRTFFRKMKEAAYAIRLNFHFEKNQILEKYLNTVYFGSMSYGAQAAALNYFNKNLSDLDLAHYSFLAGLPASPALYNPRNNFKYAKIRQKYVLDQMIAVGYISNEEADAAYDQKIELATFSHPIQAPHFVFHVIGELEKQFGNEKVNFGGLKVITTLDLGLNREAERIITHHVDRLSRSNLTNAALLATDLNGRVIAWVGSKNYFDDSISGQVDIIMSLRQPGSALKPFLYLLAFKKGYNPASILADLPVTFQTATGPYSPKNYNLEYNGPVRARVALANSYNIPAVNLLSKIGILDFVIFLRTLGFESLNRSSEHYGLSLTLGGGEIKMSEMLKAYLILANDGLYKDLKVIDSIIADDKVIYGDISETLLNLLNEKEIAKLSKKNTYFDNKISDSKEILRSSYNVFGLNAKQNAFLIKNILSDVDARLESFGESPSLDLDFPAAVKTGTTRNFRDNWTMGFSSEIVVGVWAGNADASPMKGVSGVDGAAPIWRDFMITAHRGKNPTAFVPPKGVIRLKICALSGSLFTEECEKPIFEWFRKGEEPSEKENFYKKFMCFEKGELVERIFIDWPPEYLQWASQRNLLPPDYCLKKSEEKPFIQIIFPSDNDSFALISDLPKENQKIPIRLIVSGPLREANLVVRHEKFSIEKTAIKKEDKKGILDESENVFESNIPLEVSSTGSLTVFLSPIKGKYNVKAVFFDEKSKAHYSDSVNFSVK